MEKKIEKNTKVRKIEYWIKYSQKSMRWLYERNEQNKNNQ